MKPVCLVLGAGAGIGGTVAKKFAIEGYHSCLCRRSDQGGLNKLVSSIEEAGGSATGYLVDAIEENVLEHSLLLHPLDSLLQSHLLLQCLIPVCSSLLDLIVGINRNDSPL